MKPITELITRVRRETRNSTGTGVTAGDSIKDAEFVDYLNDAQELCQESISGVFSKFFETTKIYTIDTSVSSYEELTIPTDCLLGTRIASVEYSHDGSEANYMNLTPLDIRERYSTTGGGYSRFPEGYMRTASKIIITPVPNQNGAKVRVVYEKAVLRLDVAKIDGVTAAGRVAAVLSGVTWAAANGHDDLQNWDAGDLVNIIDRATGVMVAQDATLGSGFAVGGTNAGSTTIDLSSGTYDTTLIDALLTRLDDVKILETGRTTISELPNSCEKYLVAYAALLVFERDASVRLAKAAEKRFQRISDSLIKSYIQEARDWPAIPETDY